MTEQTTVRGISDALATALSNYMLAVYGRRPTKSEIWDIYCSTIDAIDKAAKGGAKKAKSDGP